MEISSGADAPALRSVVATLDTRARGLVVARGVLSLTGLEPATYYARPIVDGRRLPGRWFSVGDGTPAVR
jgi:hypothetical protein